MILDSYVTDSSHCVCKEGEHCGVLVCALGWALGARNSEELTALLETFRKAPSAITHNRDNLMPPCRLCGVKMAVGTYGVGSTTNMR